MEVKRSFSLPKQVHLGFNYGKIPNQLTYVLTYKFCLIADNIKAINDTYLIGDLFLRSIWPTMLATKNKAIANKTQKPFLFNNFNILPCYSPVATMTKSILARLINEFINTLGENRPMLKYLLFLPDKDIIEAVHHGGFGCKFIFEKILTWMMANIEEALEVRKEDLNTKRAGALFQSEFYPKIIWTLMPGRPYITNTNKGYVFAQRNTFNAVLTSVTNKFKNFTTLDVALPDDRTRRP